MGQKPSTKIAAIHANLLFCIHLVADCGYWEKLGGYPVTFVVDLNQTDDCGQAYWKDSLSFIWITLVAAVITLVVSLFLLEWTSAAFGEHIVGSFDTLHQCLACKLRVMLDDTPPPEVTQAENLDKELIRKSVALDSVYEQAAFEIRLGRLNGQLVFQFCVDGHS